MKTYIVTVNELHRRKYRMKANTMEEAEDLVLDGQADVVPGSDEFIRTTGIYEVEEEK